MLSIIRKLLGLATAKDMVSSGTSDTRSADAETGVTYTLRGGKPTQIDDSFRAWTSGNLDAMLAVASKKTNPIDRHFLLLGIVAETYKRRKDPAMRAKCLEFCALHLQEFPQIAPELKRWMDGVLPRVPTFQQFATVLTEEGRYDEAVDVCKAAIRYELRDGTASGFEGRIARIQRLRDKLEGA